MKLNVTVFPENITVTVPKNTSLYKAISLSGVSFSADCGGNGKCQKCKVKLLKGRVEGTLPDEKGMISSCKAILTEDVEIELPESNLEKINLVTLKNAENSKNLGAVLDIGTTTLATALIDLTRGEVFKKATCFNGQRVFGSDVLSRINASKNGNLQKLQNIVIKQTNLLLKALSEGVSTKIQKLLVVGNTTMLHIFAGEDPTSIGAYPFTPVFLESLNFKGEDLGVLAEEVTLLPSASAYVGADIVAGALFCNFPNSNKNELLVDVGTNGEMMLSVNGKLYATSTAAGPALEGASMECGLSGSPGAVNHVFYRGGRLGFTTVGDKPEKGICGSGYIDLISLLLKEGIIDEYGGFEENSKSALVKHLKNDRFYITDNVYLSKKDISEFQLAKSAIFSGIKALLKHCNLRENQIETLYLAGGMGYHINPLNAAISGLIPISLYSKVKALENSALEGAIQCISNTENLKKTEEISKTTEIVELSFSTFFQDEYIKNMCFLK